MKQQQKPKTKNSLLALDQGRANPEKHMAIKYKVGKRILEMTHVIQCSPKVSINCNQQNS